MKNHVNNVFGRGRYAAALIVLGVLAVAASMAGAGDATIYPPPQIREPERAPTLVNMFVAVLLLAAAMGASMIPSKRGHQD